MQSLIQFALRRPVTILMLFTGTVLFGGVAASTLEIGFLPQVKYPKLVVTTRYPGMPPEQMRELITIPVEDALSSLKGIKHISSVSRSGTSTIELQFHWGTDMRAAGVQSREIIDGIFPALPSGAEKSRVLPVVPGEQPILRIGVIPHSGDIPFARRLAEREIKSRLQRCPEVGAIVVVGGSQEEIQVEVDRSKALNRGLTVEDIHRLISQNHIEMPAGSLVEGDLEYIVTAQSSPANIEELRRSVLATGGGEALTLEEVARVHRKDREQRSVFLVHGEEAIGLLIHPRSGASPVSASREVRTTLLELQRSYAKDLDFQLLEDRSTLVRASIGSLALSAILGAAAAFLVLLLFLRSLASAATLAASIPISISAALLIMRLSGITLNTISLGGLALGIGMIVDSSVVVLDNIRRRVAQRPHPADKADIARAAAEVAGPALAATLTSLVVFLPLLLLPGILGALYRDLALTISFSLVVAYLLSVTLLPVLSYWALSRETSRHFHTTERFSRIRKGYAQFLALALRHPWSVVLLTLLLGAGGVAAAGTLPREFMPPLHRTTLRIIAEPPPGSSIAHCKDIATALSQHAESHPAVAASFARIGGEVSDPFFLADPQESGRRIHLSLRLHRRVSTSPKRLSGYFRSAFETPDIAVTIPPQNESIAPLIGIPQGAARYIVTGDTQHHALERARHLAAAIAERTGTSPQIFPAHTAEMLSLTPLRKVLARSSQSVAELSRAIRSSTHGSYPSRLTIEGREVDVRVRLRERDRDSLDDLRAIPVPAGTSGHVPAGELLRIERRPQRPALSRFARKDAVLISPAADHDGGVRMREYLDDLAQSHSYLRSASASALQEHSRELLFIVVTAVVLMYFLLGAQFESLIQPLFVLISLPFGMIGAVLLLFAAGGSINSSSSLGVLLLLGIVVNNSILLFAAYRAKIEAGSPPAAAVYRGSLGRLRPILITAATTIIAMTPIAIDPYNSSAQSSLALSVIGGLLCSTLLTLVLTPLATLRYYRSAR